MQRLIEEAKKEANAIRLFINPMNLVELFSNDIKPLSKRRCLHAHMFGGSNSNIMKRFMERQCEIVVRNPVLSQSEALYMPEYRLVKDSEWLFLSTTGYFMRIYEYLTPLEYYTLENPGKIPEILNYIKNIDDFLLL